MSAILERVQADFDTITAGQDEILNRAVEENRELTAEETQSIERDQSRAERLRADIERYSAMETTRREVETVMSRIPNGGAPRLQRAAAEPAPEPDVLLQRAFPTLGDYMITVARALAGDQAAAERIDRATADQTTGDNPGLIPRPILGPVVNLMDTTRPFIASIAQRPLPASGAFDRPKITQHVKVGKQAGEKTETASQKLLLGKLPVVPDTFAGHIDISRQDIRRTTPGIMQIIAEDFGVQYSLETDAAAAWAFELSVEGNAPITVPTWGPADVITALFAAAAIPLRDHIAVALPNTLWVAPDIWAALGGLVSPNGGMIFPSLSPDSNTGNILGLRLVVDAYFAPGTAIMGSNRLAEWYEDVDGLLQVADVPLYGTTVGFAGDGAFLNTAPETFSTLAFPPIAGGAASTSTAKKAA